MAGSASESSASGSASSGGCRVRSVKLVRRNPPAKLGFSVRGGREHATGFFVTSVEPNSEAHCAGLRAGDQIIRVNGYPVDDATHGEILQLIQSHTTIVLRVRTVGMIPEKEDGSGELSWRLVEGGDVESSTCDVWTPQTDSLRQVSLSIKVPPKAKLGCGICKGPDWKPGIFVQFTKENSIARLGGLRPGDQILQCNNIPFTPHMPFNEAVSIMRGCGVLELVISKGAGLELFPGESSGYNSSASSVTGECNQISATSWEHSSNSTQQDVEWNNQSNLSTIEAKSSNSNHNNNYIEVSIQENGSSSLSDKSMNGKQHSNGTVIRNHNVNGKNAVNGPTNGHQVNGKTLVNGKQAVNGTSNGHHQVNGKYPNGLVNGKSQVNGKPHVNGVSKSDKVSSNQTTSPEKRPVNNVSTFLGGNPDKRNSNRNPSPEKRPVNGHSSPEKSNGKKNINGLSNNRTIPDKRHNGISSDKKHLNGSSADLRHINGHPNGTDVRHNGITDVRHTNGNDVRHKSSDKAVINGTSNSTIIQVSPPMMHTFDAKVAEICMVSEQTETKTTTVLVEVHHSDQDQPNQSDGQTSSSVSSFTSSAGSLRCAISQELQRRSKRAPRQPTEKLIKSGLTKEEVDKHEALMSEFKQAHHKMFPHQIAKLPEREEEKKSESRRSEGNKVKRCDDSARSRNKKAPPPPPPMPNCDARQKKGPAPAPPVDIPPPPSTDPPSCPTPDYDSCSLASEYQQSNDRVDMQSLESFRLTNPHTGKPKPPDTYFPKECRSSVVVRPVVTIGQYGGGNDKKVSRLEFLNEPVPTSKDEPIQMRLASELNHTLAKSSLKNQAVSAGPYVNKNHTNGCKGSIIKISVENPKDSITTIEGRKQAPFYLFPENRRNNTVSFDLSPGSDHAPSQTQHGILKNSNVSHIQIHPQVEKQIPQKTIKFGPMSVVNFSN